MCCECLAVLALSGSVEDLTSDRDHQIESETRVSQILKSVLFTNFEAIEHVITC